MLITINKRQAVFVNLFLTTNIEKKMQHKVLLVVSDKFSEFAMRKDVITQSELFHLLRSEDVLLPHHAKTRLVPGQGFSDDNVDEIINAIETSLNGKYFDASLWLSLPRRASKALTHKHNSENILISDPIKICEDNYEMQVLVDENCELMGDHQTGQHLQGMLLLEAARQASVAVMEKYFLNGNENKLYFVFNEMNVNYNRFAFPLACDLSFAIKEKDVSKPKRQDFSVEVSAMQCGVSSASFTFGFTMMEDTRVSNMENRLAKQALNDFMEKLNSEVIYAEAANA